MRLREGFSKRPAMRERVKSLFRVRKCNKINGLQSFVTYYCHILARLDWGAGGVSADPNSRRVVTSPTRRVIVAIFGNVREYGRI